MISGQSSNRDKGTNLVIPTRKQSPLEGSSRQKQSRRGRRGTESRTSSQIENHVMPASAAKLGVALACVFESEPLIVGHKILLWIISRGPAIQSTQEE